MVQSLTADERFDKADAQLSEMNKQLDRIATAVLQGFERVDKKLEDKANKTDMQRVYDYLDKIIKQQEINDDERLVMGHQLERMDRWVPEVADKIGYTLAA
jgi:flagellin-like hook-associated protein FlgL